MCQKSQRHHHNNKQRPNPSCQAPPGAGPQGGGGARSVTSSCMFCCPIAHTNTSQPPRLAHTRPTRFPKRTTTGGRSGLDYSGPSGIVEVRCQVETLVNLCPHPQGVFCAPALWAHEAVRGGGRYGQTRSAWCEQGYVVIMLGDYSI